MTPPLKNGDRLRGTVTKDNLQLYTKSFDLSTDFIRRTLGKNSLKFCIYDEAEPVLKVNDKCQLILESGRVIDVQVTDSVALPADLYMVCFSFQEDYGGDEMPVES